MKGDIEVAPDGDEWTVRAHGSMDEIARYDDKDDAVKDGRLIADARDVELFIKGEDGVIQKRDSHGNDPPPPESPDEGWQPNSSGVEVDAGVVLEAGAELDTDVDLEGLVDAGVELDAELEADLPLTEKPE